MKMSPFVVGSAKPETPYEKDIEKGLDKVFTSLQELLNNGLSFGDNFSGYVATITTDATPGTPTAIAHGLKRVPIGCLVIEQDKAGSIFKASKDATNYNVASDVASVTATVVIL